MAKIVIFFLSVIYCVQYKVHGINQQPLVAFKCNKPSMYLGPNGWVEDQTTDCLSDISSIFSYCKEVYPDRDIRNIVEAAETVRIQAWCNFDHRDCQEHEVRPYRCLGQPLIVEDDSNLLVEANQPMQAQPDPPVGPVTGDQEFFRHYLEDGDDDQYTNEHAYFLKAKSDLMIHHHDKVTKMMKDWAEAREQVQAMRKIDPNRAEKLHQEISNRFQRTYEALEQEGQLEKQQVLAVHQQRVQSKLNQRKRTTMEQYMEALTEPNPEKGAVLKRLIQYIKAEEKDRLHSINHLMHVQEIESAEELAVVRDQTLQHIEIIDERIRQAISMLDRVPQLQDKIRPEIDKYLSTFEELDREIESVREQQQPEEQPAPAQHTEPQPEEPAEPALHRVALGPDTLDTHSYDDEIDEDEHHQVSVAHMEEMKLEIINDPMARRSEVASSSLGYSTVSVAVAMAAVAVFIILLVGVLILRHRHLSRNVPTAVQVATSPEERHVANMQMNGYENPTYRYFEMNAQA